MHHFEAHELADSWELRAGLLDEDPADASISACLRECAAALRNITTPSPAPAHEPIGYLCRHRANVADAIKAFGPDKDLSYLWSYTHGTAELELMERCAHLEVVRVYGAVQAPAVGDGERLHPYGRCTITGPAEDVAFIFRHLPDAGEQS